MLRSSLWLALVAACSSKGNVAPVADAGLDQLVTPGVLVQLDGSGSSDIDGEVSDYTWSLISAPASSVSILEGEGVAPTLRVDQVGRYVVSLTVSDNDGEGSYPDIVELVSTAPAERPIALLSVAGTLGIDETLIFDGSNSTAAPDRPIVSWDFSVLVSPGSATLAVDDTSPTQATLNPDAEGVWIIGLEVSDGELTSRAATLEFEITNTVNQPPVALCGSDSVVQLGDLAAVDGSASVDPDGDPLTYLWTIRGPDGEIVPGIGMDEAVARFESTRVGRYTASLVVSDNVLSSEPCSTTVDVTETIENSAPYADAGADVWIDEPSTVRLDGNASFDPDGDPLTAAWSILSRPVGSELSDIEVSESDGLLASVTPDAIGTYIIGLTVCDDTSLCGSDAMSIVVGGGENKPPQANAGPDRDAEVGVAVPLDGSESTDPDGDALTYSWQLIDSPPGSGALIADSDRVDAELNPDVEGTFLVRLEVSDGMATATDWVTISAFPEGTNLPPVCSTTGDQTTDMEIGVVIDGSATFDPNLDPLDIVWSVISGPSGTEPVFDDSASPSTVFTPIEPGEYVLQFSAADATESCTEQIIVTAIDTSPNTPPVCDAGGDVTVLFGETATLDGSGTTDLDEDELIFLWEINSSPGGSSAEIDDPIAQTTTFTPDRIGVYGASLTVSDGEDACSERIVIDVQEPVVNTPPVCATGPDQTVELGALVSLDGTASSDADDDPLSFEWRVTERPEGSSATITDLTLPIASFVPDVEGTYRIRVIVNDGSDDCPEPAEMVLTVTDNDPPSCNAGPDLEATVGELLSLDGSATSDPDGDSLAYQWLIVERPEGSTATLSDLTLPVATFIPDITGTYSIRIRADDGSESCTDFMSLVVTGNTPPVCDAGGDLSATIGDTVTLDASGTTDADGDALGYQWRIIERPEGSTATIDAVTLKVTTFSPDLSGSYLIRLTADDGTETCRDELTLNVEGNAPPVCEAGPDATVELGETATLDARETADPDGDPLTYQWRIIERPEGSTATIDAVTLRLTTFTPDEAGDYTIRITADDGTDSCRDELVLSVTEPPNTPPECDAGPDQAVALGDEVALDASGSSDPDGDALVYQWRIIERPEGSTATIDAVTLKRTTFTPDVLGLYTIRIIVDDGREECRDDMLLTVGDVGGGDDTGSPPGGGPSADAGRDLILCNSGEIELDGTDSTGDDLNFSWTFVDLPDGSSLTDADFIASGSSTPSFIPDTEGRFVIELTVTDSTGSDTDTVAITLNAGGSVLTFHLDEGSGDSAEDGSPEGNDGVITNPNWTGGRFFAGLAFDSTTSLRVEDNDSLDLSDDFTIDWWMRTEEIGDGWRAVLTKGSAYNYSVWTFDNELYFSAVTESGSDVFVGGVATTLGDGAWHHYAATVGDGTMNVYEDGVLLASDTLSSPLLSNSAPLQIGRPADTTAAEYFVGALDELNIRNGALAEEDIAILADATTQTCTGEEDDSPPSAAITDPSGTASTDIGYIKVEGTALDESAIASVSVNGAAAAATSDNYATWVAYVPLVEGSNTLIAQVEDIAGNVNTSAGSVSATYNNVCGDDTILLLGFDEDTSGTAIDWGPNGSDASESGVGRSIGQFGNALRVAGTGSVSVAHNADLAAGGPVSVELWMRRDGDSSDLEVLVAKGDPSTYGMAIFGDTLIFGFDDSDLTEFATFATGVTDGDWHHVVGVFDGTELSLYIDGALASTTPSFGGSPAVNTQDLAIGSFFGLGATLNGEIDQLRIYDDALSASEIVDRFAEGEACPLGENLALGAVAESSSTLNPLFTADNAIDDSTDEEAELDYTMWLGENDTASWIQIDFGSVVGVLRVRWANTHNRSYFNRATTSYRIEASATGAFGEEAVPIASGTGSMETQLRFHTEDSSPVAARYLRFYADEWEGLGPGINEIQVYGLE